MSERPQGTRAVAGLPWAQTDEDSGIFYEVEDCDPETLHERLQAGIEHGCRLQDIDPAIETKVATEAPAPQQYVTAIVIAAYGESEPLV